MMHCIHLLWWLVVAFVMTSFPTAATAQPFPFPQAAPCAGPNVVPAAVEALAAQISVVNEAIDRDEPGISRTLQGFAEAACSAGDRMALDVLFDRCFRDCDDLDAVYDSRIEYAGALARFGDVAAAEYQYVRAIEMRPGRPTEAIEAYNNFALLLDRQGRPLAALELLSRFDDEELRRYGFPRTLKSWVMREMGMDVAAEQAALAQGARVPIGALPFGTMPGTPGERPIEPVVVELRSDVSLAPRSSANALDEQALDEQARLFFSRAGTRDPSTLQRNLTLTEGQRFTVVAVLGGDACRIEYAGNSYDLVRCPWMLDTGDRQRDRYRVLGPRASARARAREPQQTFILPPVPSEGVANAAAGEWARWRAFYSRRENGGLGAAAAQALSARTGLSDESAAVVLEAGQAYLAELSAIDAEARQELVARFGAPMSLDRVPLPPGPDGSERRLPVLVSSQTADGRSVQEVLAAEGFAAHIEERKQALLEAHRQHLLGAIGAERLAVVESLVDPAAAARRAETVP